MFSIKRLCSHLYNSEAVAVTYSAKKVFLKISLGAESSVIDSRLKFLASRLPLKKDNQTLVFSYNFCKIFKNTFFFCKIRKNARFYELPDFGNFQYTSFKVALGFRKSRSSRRLKFWKLFFFWELHHEKTFFYGGKKRLLLTLFSPWNCLLLR